MRIHPALGLGDDELAAIAALERRVVAHNGGRLKLEWNTLRRRSGARVEDLLARDGERLVGFLGLYGFAPPSVELTGMVDPGHRRGGIATALLDRGLALCAERGVREALLVVPRESEGGRALAVRRTATLHHTEYALLLEREPVDGRSDPALTVRTAQTADVADVMRLLGVGFGFAPPDVADRLVEPHARTLVAERTGRIVATLRVSRSDARGDVSGFVVDPRLRGRGIGRDVLRRVCRDLRADGATRVGLEVAADNDGALHLYTSLGFAPATTEDYWAIIP